MIQGFYLTSRMVYRDKMDTCGFHLYVRCCDGSAVQFDGKLDRLPMIT